MTVEITREEFEARVGVLEHEVEGEKMVTRHILEQTRHNTNDLATIKTQLDSVERKVDGLDQKVSGLDQKVGRLEYGFNTLIRDLPKIITDAVREANRDLKK